MSNESKHLTKLDSEIEEMEAFFNKKKESPKPEEDGEEDVEITEEDSTLDTDEDEDSSEGSEEDDSLLPTDTDSDDAEDSDDEETDKPQKRKKYTDWKSRYKSLRAHHDSLIYDLRKELAEVKSSLVEYGKKNVELHKTLASQKQDKDDFTDEEREVLGDEAIEVLRRTTRNAVDPIKKELDEERKLRLRQQEESAKSLQEENKRLFISRFAGIVPDYVKIDKDEKFINFMKGIDSASGYDRTTLFRRAVQNGDVVRAAGFYQEYLTRTKKSPLSKRVTPTGSSASSTPRNMQDKNGEIITSQYIDKFYDDIVRGKYKGKLSLQNEIEAKIDKAVSEGRVRF